MGKIICAALAPPVNLLAGCVSPAEQQAMDRQRCTGFGFAPGTTEMANCMMQVAQQREAGQAAMQRVNAQNMALQQQADRERAAASAAREAAVDAKCLVATGANAGSMICR